MSDNSTISLKSESALLTKKKLNLAMNILISVLGISSLFIKFFLVDGVLAFRAFTVDGNLFTTIVSVIAVVFNIKALKIDDDLADRRLFFLELSSAVTEAVIFIVVMIGYLPFFTDDPKITPYHMFCLHVAIPILAVARFILFEKPQGILKPVKLLIGSIPIGVYGVGVVTAIKLGILPIALVPYSFLNFDANFLWFFLFALIVIPSFGFLWSWLFYRTNIRASLLWYSKDDIEKLKEARVKALSNFDVVNSSILLVYCVLALALMMFSLHGTSKTSTKIQHELMAYMSFYMLDDYNYRLGPEDWCIKDGALYKGDIFVGDGTEKNENNALFPDDMVIYDVSIFVRASDLSDEVAALYDGYDFVSVNHSSGKKGPVNACGTVLDKNMVASILTSETHEYGEVEKINNVKYYHYCMSFGATMLDDDLGIMSIYVPESELTKQAKEAEYSQDLSMISIVVIIFAILYILTYKWIKTLEKSYDFVKAIASGRTPEDPIVLGKTARLSGLTRELNILREINKE